MADSAIERAARKRRLKFQEADHARAMYGWHHPDNIAWAADRHRFDLEADLRRRIADLQAALNRQHVADEASEAVEPEGEKACGPLVIRRRGGLHRAK